MFPFSFFIPFFPAHPPLPPSFYFVFLVLCRKEGNENISKTLKQSSPSRSPRCGVNESDGNRTVDLSPSSGIVVRASGFTLW